MAKQKKGKTKPDYSPRIVNRRARHDYAITETLECGIKLVGSEVKSVRLGKVSLAEGYASVDPKSMALELHNIDIAHYPQAGEHQHEPKRTRRLLAHKQQINQLMGATTSKGTTLIPLAMYFTRGVAKVEIGVAEGKKHQDKRQDLKKKEHEREMRRAMTRRTL